MIDSTRDTHNVMRDLLNAANTAVLTQIDSKKAALQALCKIMSDQTALDHKKLLSLYIARERLGSTSIGYGIAIPHIHLADLDKPYGTLILLDTPVDFDAPDDTPVDLLFGLLVPEGQNETHLKILSQIANYFNCSEFRSKLRQSEDARSLLQAAVEYSLQSS